jgi:hypothetical protein
MSALPINCTEAELSTYLQALEAGYLPTSCLDTSASEQSKLIPIASKSYTHGKKTVSFLGFPSFRMLKHSKENHGAEKSTSLREARHAKESAPHEQTILPMEGLELMAEAQSFFTNTSELLEKHNRTFVFGKTLQQSPLKDLKRCSPLLTRWGITRAGECLSVQATVRTMNASGCSLLPTPTSHNAKEGNYPAEHTRNTKSLAAQIGGKINPAWNEWRMGWPANHTALSPLATDSLQAWLRSHGMS